MRCPEVWQVTGLQPHIMQTGSAGTFQSHHETMHCLLPTTFVAVSYPVVLGVVHTSPVLKNYDPKHYH